MNLKTTMVLEPDFAKQIFVFVENNKDLFVFNGPGRKYYSTLKTKEKINTNLKIIRKLCLQNLGVEEFFEEPEFGIFIGVNTESGFVHEHMDYAEDKYVHFRLNFLVSKPEFGGVPVVNNEEIEVDELESWINLASKWLHKSTPVVGKKPRIVLSLGALITENQAEKVVKKCNIY